MFKLNPIRKNVAIGIFQQCGYLCYYSGRNKILHTRFVSLNKPIYNDFKAFYAFLREYTKYDISRKSVKDMPKTTYLSRDARIKVVGYFLSKFEELGVGFQIESSPF